MRRLLVPALLLLLALPAAAEGKSRLRLKPVVSGLSLPLAVASPPGNRHDLYVAERAGRVVLVRDGSKRRTPFLDLNGEIPEPDPYLEDGFLSLVFAPDFRKSRKLYVAYSTNAKTQRFEEWRANAAGTRVVEGSRRKLIEFPHPEAHHYGGDMHFGPDGKLYLSVGDGAVTHGHTPGMLAQDLGSLQGKILRIDPRPAKRRPYRIPRGNPFRHRRGARPEIWAYGLRNPWRFSFAPRTGDLIIGDVSEARREELDWVRGPRAGRGVNFGWPCRDASLPFDHAPADCRAPRARGPAFEYTHFPESALPTIVPGRRMYPPRRGGVHASHMTEGCTGAITGGFVMRDPQLPGLRGRYAFGDFCHGGLMTARRKGKGAIVHGLLQSHRLQLVSFGLDGCGRLHVLHLYRGTVSRLQRGKSRCVLPERG